MKIFRSTFLVALVVASTLVFGLLGWSLSVNQVPEYRTTSTMLVIYKQGDLYDPSNALRASEKISEQLSNIIRTDAFMREVIARDVDLLSDHTNYAAQVQYWKTNIASVNNNSFITVEVTNTSRSEAHRLSKIITQVMTTQSQKWHGAGSEIRVMLVESPTTPEKPVSPTPVLNTFIGMFIGLTLSIIAIYYGTYLAHYRNRINLNFFS